MNTVAAECPDPEQRSPTSTHNQGHPILLFLKDVLSIGIWDILLTLSFTQNLDSTN